MVFFIDFNFIMGCEHVGEHLHPALVGRGKMKASELHFAELRGVNEVFNGAFNIFTLFELLLYF